MSSHFCALCDQLYDLNQHIPRRLQCSCVYCEKCLKIYSKVHKLKYQSKIEELEIPNSLLSEDQVIKLNQLEQRCQQHQDIFKFVCINDGMQVCGTCTITTHQGHSFQPIELKLKQMQNQIQQELHEMKQQMQVEQRIKELENKQNQFCFEESYLRNSSSNILNFFVRKVNQICQEELEGLFQQLLNDQQEIIVNLIETKDIQKQFLEIESQKLSNIEECKQGLQAVINLKEKIGQIN